MEIITEIFNKAKIFLTEGLPFGNDELLLEVCAMARDELTQRLRDDVDIEGVREIFVRSAGLLAVSKLLGLDSRRVESFSAGSIQVSCKSGEGSGGISQALERQAELMLRGYLKDFQFDFKAVRG